MEKKKKFSKKVTSVEMKYRFVTVEDKNNPFELSITPLNSKITQEDKLSCFGRELVLHRSKNMNKTDTIKDTRRKAEKRLIRKNDRMRDLII